MAGVICFHRSFGKVDPVSEGVLRAGSQTSGFGLLHRVRRDLVDRPYNVLFLCTGN
jgi:hypothetical protein